MKGFKIIHERHHGIHFTISWEDGQKPSTLEMADVLMEMTAKALAELERREK